MSIKTKTSRVNLLSKVYIWSVVMDPLIFFILVPQSITGVGANFSRILQFLVVVSLCLKLLVPERVRIPNPFSPLNINYTYYFFFAVLAGYYGIVSGAYNLDIGMPPSVSDRSFIADIIFSNYFQPFLQYFITIYYFAYFVILARYLISNKEAINYFFRLFFIALFICFFVGYLDMLQFTFTDHSFPRHLYSKQDLGFRFKGIAGEPRDAFNYLMLSLGMLALRDIWEDKKKLTLFWFVFVTLTAMLTQSASGLIGIVFFCFLLIIYYLPSVSLKIKLVFIFLVLTGAVLIYLNVTTSVRLMNYYNSFYTLYSELDTGAEISPVGKLFMNNVYPIWHLWTETREFNFLPLIIGNGLGSVSVVNNHYYMTTSELTNPNAFIIRSLYETGVIGTLFFIAAFLRPLKKLDIDYKLKEKLKLFMLLTLSMYFAHKTAIPYIFFGITLVVLKNKFITSGSISEQ